MRNRHNRTGDNDATRHAHRTDGARGGSVSSDGDARNGGTREQFTRNLPARSGGTRERFNRDLPTCNGDTREQFTRNLPARNGGTRERFNRNLPAHNGGTRERFNHDLPTCNGGTREQFTRDLPARSGDARKPFNRNGFVGGRDARNEVGRGRGIRRILAGNGFARSLCLRSLPACCRFAGKNGVMAALAAMIVIGWTVGLTGCRSAEEMAMVDVPVRGWHHGVEVKVNPPDTETLYDLDLLVRYNHNFTVDTLTLWFRTQSADTLIYTERCRFALPMSERPAAIRPVVDLPWRCGVRFAGAEAYKIRITPLQPVHGIEAVGIRLRPVTQTQEE